MPTKCVPDNFLRLLDQSSTLSYFKSSIYQFFLNGTHHYYGATRLVLAIGVEVKLIRLNSCKKSPLNRQGCVT